MTDVTTLCAATIVCELLALACWRWTITELAIAFALLGIICLCSGLGRALAVWP